MDTAAEGAAVTTAEMLVKVYLKTAAVGNCADIEDMATTKMR